jgi:hypothetical protein
VVCLVGMVRHLRGIQGRHSRGLRTRIRPLATSGWTSRTKAAAGDIDVENFPTLAVFRGAVPIRVTLPQQTVVARTVSALSAGVPRRVSVPTPSRTAARPQGALAGNTEITKPPRRGLRASLVQAGAVLFFDALLRFGRCFRRLLVLLVGVFTTLLFSDACLLVPVEFIFVTRGCSFDEWNSLPLPAGWCVARAANRCYASPGSGSTGCTPQPCC